MSYFLQALEKSFNYHMHMQSGEGKAKEPYVAPVGHPEYLSLGVSLSEPAPRSNHHHFTMSQFQVEDPLGYELYRAEAKRLSLQIPEVFDEEFTADMKLPQQVRRAREERDNASPQRARKERSIAERENAKIRERFAKSVAEDVEVERKRKAVEEREARHTARADQERAPKKRTLRSRRPEASRPHASTSARKGSEKGTEDSEDAEDSEDEAAAGEHAVSTAARKGKERATLPNPAALTPSRAAVTKPTPPARSRDALVTKKRTQLSVHKARRPIASMVASNARRPPPGVDSSRLVKGADDDDDEDDDLSSHSSNEHGWEQSPNATCSPKADTQVSLLGARTFFSSRKPSTRRRRIPWTSTRATGPVRGPMKRRSSATSGPDGAP